MINNVGYMENTCEECDSEYEKSFCAIMNERIYERL